MNALDWLPLNLTPDLVTVDSGYARTGILNKDGHMILRRVSKPIGFGADHFANHYMTEWPDD